MRFTSRYKFAEGQPEEIKYKVLNWVNRFGIFLYLDSHQYTDRYGRYELLVAAGVAGEARSLGAVQSLHEQHKDWLFGNICYDHKNELEPRLSSTHPQRYGFPSIYFFRPQIVLQIVRDSDELVVSSLNDDADNLLQEILAADSKTTTPPALSFQQKISKEEYLNAVRQLRSHIKEGDCYEINFCAEGFCEQASIVPSDVFSTLSKLSPAPFSAFYRLNELYMMCASPERYLLKQGRKLISQPIKGTARRDADELKDVAIKEELYQNIKERAENVMITDLVRNDLARSCEVGSIHVDELFGIYSFPQVHQMISTVSGILRQDVPFTDAIRHSFPMGSMTGAPKIKVMELIDRYESSRRELFAGTVGYIDPNGALDLNVIIRSLYYDLHTQYLSYQTGGAITYDSDPELEYEEMRLKAWALERVFS